MLKAIEIEITFFFIPLGIPRVERWIISFGSFELKMFVITLAEIFLKLSMKNSRGTFTYWDDFILHLLCKDVFRNLPPIDFAKSMLHFLPSI